MIGPLCQSERGQVLAQILADVETDPDDLTRLRLNGAVRQVLGETPAERIARRRGRLS